MPIEMSLISRGTAVRKLKLGFTEFTLKKKKYALLPSVELLNHPNAVPGKKQNTCNNRKKVPRMSCLSKEIQTLTSLL